MVKPKLSNKALNLANQVSPIRQIMKYTDPSYFKKIGVDPAKVISFSGGWVNHESPEDLKEAYREISNDASSFHKSGAYSPTLGMPQCKDAIVNYEKHIYDINGLGINQIAIGASSTQLTFALLGVLLNNNDKILLFDPAYCNFPLQVRAALDAKIITFPVVDSDKWRYVADEKIEEIKEFILKEKPKVVLLTSPDNPTSQVPSDKFVSSVLEAVSEIGSFLVVDFAYKDIIFTKVPEYFSWGPNENYISIHSNSKWGRGLGRRMGWIEAPEEIIGAMESTQGSMILSPDTLHQMSFTNYINKSIKENTLKPYLKKVCESYKAAADKTIESIKNHLGLPCFIPQGGLYTSMKVGVDGEKFVEEVIMKAGVIFVPGWGFGETQKNAVRISYGPLVKDLDKIEEAMKRVGELLQKHVAVEAR